MLVVIVGAINWGIVGFSGNDLVGAVFGPWQHARSAGVHAGRRGWSDVGMHGDHPLRRRAPRNVPNDVRTVLAPTRAEIRPRGGGRAKSRKAS